jgi:hypothetical protein
MAQKDQIQNKFQNKKVIIISDEWKSKLSQHDYISKCKFHNVRIN